MSHYEARLEHDLKNIQEQVKTIAEQVDDALHGAVHALLTGNHKLAYSTILGDGPINRAVRALDRSCHAFIAVHLPSAGHLRFMSAVIRVNIELERIGDYAVTICRESVQLSSPPQGTVARELEAMAEAARGMFEQAMEAFHGSNAEAGRATMKIASQISQSFEIALPDVMATHAERDIRDVFALFVVFNMLERVSDQAKNICEETVFAATGEQKAAKRYRVLLLDADNSAYGPMAEAIARKSFPESGEYASAGLDPASKLNDLVMAFMQERGLDLSVVKPRGFDLTRQELADHHVIVSLDGPLNRYLGEVPFHTVGLEWDLPELVDNLPEAEVQRTLETAYRELAVQIRDLMQLLRGQEAA
jgi:phosphate transport system protein